MINGFTTLPTRAKSVLEVMKPQMNNKGAKKSSEKEMGLKHSNEPKDHFGLPQKAVENSCDFLGGSPLTCHKKLDLGNLYLIKAPKRMQKLALISCQIPSVFCTE